MPRAVIMAGGTGGHIFPALAVANSLRDNGWQIIWLGTADRLEADLVPKHGFPIHFLPVKGIRGKGFTSKISGLAGILKSVFWAIGSIKNHKADVVLGFGGYPSFPGGVAAKILGKPLFIHEQNAVAGLTNKLLGKLASQVFLGFPSAAAYFNKPKSKIHIVGNPVRQEILPKTKPNSEDASSSFKLLIIGGSLGARPLNQMLPLCISQINTPHKIEVVHQCGKGNQHSVSEAYQSVETHAHVSDFIEDMAGAYQWADAVVCRAGALTVAEVAKVGVAACFVPLPHAVDDHQTKNAEYLANKHGAVVMPQTQLSEKLTPLLEKWVNNKSICWDMGQSATQCLPNNAIDAITTACQKIIKEPGCQQN